MSCVSSVFSFIHSLIHWVIHSFVHSSHLLSTYTLSGTLPGVGKARQSSTLHICICYLLVTGTKILDRSNLREGGIIWAHTQRRPGRKRGCSCGARSFQCLVTQCFLSGSREKNVSSFSSLSVQSRPPGRHGPPCGRVSLPWLNISRLS